MEKMTIEGQKTTKKRLTCMRMWYAYYVSHIKKLYFKAHCTYVFV
jgi:hypothetical protein